ILNWAFRSSGVLRFASEDFDLWNWQFNGFFNGGDFGMPQPLFQCTEWETLRGLSYTGGESLHDSYYQFDPEGLLVTVTRMAGSRGRLLVDFHTEDGSSFFPENNAIAYTNYIPVTNTLVFDDQEMSKTIVIKIIS